MDEIAWQHHLKQVKHAEEIKAILIELYGEYNERVIMRARFDGLIDANERWLLTQNCPF